MPSELIGGIGAIGSLAGGIGALFGGGGNKNSAVEAAQIQAASADRAAQLQYQMYQQAVEREQPWVTGGTAAVNQLGGLYNLPGYTRQDPTQTLQATPGYQWGLSQGVNARDLSAASKGLALSGAQQKGLTSYGQNYGLQTAWNPYINELNQLSSWGQSGAALQGSQGLQAGQQMGQDWMSGANAQAQGLLGQYQMDQANQAQWLQLMGAGLGMGMQRQPGGGTNFGNLYNTASNWWGGGGGGGNTDYYGGYGNQGAYGYEQTPFQW